MGVDNHRMGIIWAGEGESDIWTKLWKIIGDQPPAFVGPDGNHLVRFDLLNLGPSLLLMSATSMKMCLPPVYSSKTGAEARDSTFGRNSEAEQMLKSSCLFLLTGGGT